MTLPQLTTLVTLVALASSSIVKTPSNDGKNFELLILHNNDMHARFEQTSQLSGACTTADREAGKCYGGFPRVAHVVKEARRKAASGEGPPVLYLNAGDTYTGTAWFTIYKWKIAAEFLNALEPDAVSLGNHEFDSGITGLTPFIMNLTCPVLAANLILSKEPDLENEKNLMKSVVFNINNTKVGIIGYLTPETKVLAVRNNIEYLDEVAAIKQEVKKLKAEGVNISIALGHSGFKRDKEIAHSVDGIDLVIGGHTNTFLWNGTTPDTEMPDGPYPTYVKQVSGKLVPVVQAYAYTKYLGKLLITFDSHGEIVNVTGNPILLNNSIPQDPVVLAIVHKYQKSVNEITEIVAGRSSVYLDGQSCRISECNMGNLITDAIVSKYASEYKGDYWTDAPTAILQGGGIRSSIKKANYRYDVTVGDLYTVMPFEGYIVKVTINGSSILKMLEHSIAGYKTIGPSGKFLQMSGLRVVYDLSKPPGKKVKNTEILCGECDIPAYSNLNMTKEYNILMNVFLSMGGDGFSIFADLPATVLSYNEFQCTREYLNKTSLVHPALEDRIVIIKSLNNNAITIKISLTVTIIYFLSLILI